MGRRGGWRARKLDGRGCSYACREALPLTAPRKRARVRGPQVCARSLTSPRLSCREKSEDAYVQGDSAGAPSDLRLSRLPDILPGGEMWEKSWGLGSSFPTASLACAEQAAKP